MATKMTKKRLMQLAEQFNETMKNKVRDEFKEYLEKARTLTDNLDWDKMGDFRIPFNYQHDYFNEWVGFIIQNNKDISKNDLLKSVDFLCDNQELFISNDKMLTIIRFDFGDEFDVEIGVIDDDKCRLLGKKPHWDNQPWSIITEKTVLANGNGEDYTIEMRCKTEDWALGFLKKMYEDALKEYEITESFFGENRAWYSTLDGKHFEMYVKKVANLDNGE